VRSMYQKPTFSGLRPQASFHRSEIFFRARPAPSNPSPFSISCFVFVSDFDIRISYLFRPARSLPAAAGVLRALCGELTRPCSTTVPLPARKPYVFQPFCSPIETLTFRASLRKISNPCFLGRTPPTHCPPPTAYCPLPTAS